MLALSAPKGLSNTLATIMSVLTAIADQMPNEELAASLRALPKKRHRLCSRSEHADFGRRSRIVSLWAPAVLRIILSDRCSYFSDGSKRRNKDCCGSRKPWPIVLQLPRRMSPRLAVLAAQYTLQWARHHNQIWQTKPPCKH